MSREECAALDWRTLGYEDGVRGATGDRIGEHRTACAEYGVRPDLDAYRAGRDSGLREFCREANGYRIGLAGVEYELARAQRELDAYRAAHPTRP
jgi:hypothetical protein